VTQPTLDCQTCGVVLKKLSAAEAQQVALNPYNYVVFCGQCKKYEERRYL
jgi:uncharacterized CHY-type Zn-finger protein